ncbi:response regulator transcription factor [Agaribacter marinus]|uniref:Transcriptional regulator n=1 Tax=Agaribacter marinus TaxID=1431249 RepID=A0AA37T411_9ALTE|nr:response regulator transcription factor [Agaribacter marinus]GLR71738.1 transcriptional regulator [Agaribacter marinus]
MKLLIVEDSQRLRKSLQLGLKHLGFTVDTTGNGREAIAYLRVNHYDVVLLDLMLPEVDGLSVLKEIRHRKKESAVIVISAKDQVDDRILGLDLGADDYLCKPFDFDELHARIKSLIRRKYQLHNNVMVFGKLKVDIDMRSVAVNKQAVNLTPNEYSILALLTMNQGKVMTFNNIENHLYDSYSSVTRNAIEAHISAVRRKLKAHQVTDLIKTRRGFGYYIDAVE